MPAFLGARRALAAAPIPQAVAPVLWTPLNLSSLSVYWDADSGITLNSGNVSSWVDKKAGVAATQSTAANQPAYSATGLAGGPSVGLLSSKTLSTGLSAGQVPVTHFVFGSGARSAGANLFYGTSNNCLALNAATTGYLRLDKQGTVNIAQSTGQYPDGSVATLMVTYDGTNYDFRINGADAGSGANAQGIANQMMLLSGYGQTGIIVRASAVLSLADEQKLEGFAAWKYNSASILPAGHPYKSRAPLTSDP